MKEQILPLPALGQPVARRRRRCAQQVRVRVARVGRGREDVEPGVFAERGGDRERAHALARIARLVARRRPGPRKSSGTASHAARSSRPQSETSALRSSPARYHSSMVNSG